MSEQCHAFIDEPFSETPSEHPRCRTWTRVFWATLASLCFIYPQLEGNSKERRYKFVTRFGNRMKVMSHRPSSNRRTSRNRSASLAGMSIT